MVHRGFFRPVGVGKARWCIGVLLMVGCAAEVSREPLVDVAALDSTVVIDLKYATADNFLGKPVYPVSRCLLRRSVAQRLVRVQRALEPEGLAVKGWDGRPWLTAEAESWRCPQGTLPSEWWHFDDPSWERCPILDVPLDKIPVD